MKRLGVVEKLKGQSEASLAKLTCAEKVNINIKDACDTGISVLLTLENKGDVGIGSFVIRVNGDKTNVKEISESISPFGESAWTSFAVMSCRTSSQ